MRRAAMCGMRDRLLRVDADGTTFVASWLPRTGSLDGTMDHLSCFVGSLVLLGAEVESDAALAEAITGRLLQVLRLRREGQQQEASDRLLCVTRGALMNGVLTPAATALGGRASLSSPYRDF